MIVTVIRPGRGTVLVQWQEDGKLRRGWIPDTLISPNSEVNNRVLSEAAPGGLPFEQIFKNISISAEDLADALRRRNIWTEEDIQRNPAAIAQALLVAAQVSVSRIQTMIREFQPEVYSGE